MATRLIMIKADGTVLIHADNGTQSPELDAAGQPTDHRASSAIWHQ
jgi:RecB family endonuclease NucS